MIDYPADLEEARHTIINHAPPALQGLINTLIGRPAYGYSSRASWPLGIDISGNYDVPGIALPFLQCISQGWLTTSPASCFVYLNLVYLRCIQAIEGWSCAKDSIKGMNEIVNELFTISTAAFSRSINNNRHQHAGATGDAQASASSALPLHAISDGPTSDHVLDGPALGRVLDKPAPRTTPATPRWRLLNCVLISPHAAIVASAKKRARAEANSAAIEESKHLLLFAPLAQLKN